MVLVGWISGLASIIWGLGLSRVTRPSSRLQQWTREVSNPEQLQTKVGVSLLGFITAYLWPALNDLYRILQRDCFSLLSTKRNEVPEKKKKKSYLTQRKYAFPFPLHAIFQISFFFKITASHVSPLYKRRPSYLSKFYFTVFLVKKKKSPFLC